MVTGIERRNIAANQGYVESVAFSQDGQYVASVGSSGGNCILWDAARGTKIREFTGHKNRLMSVVFAPNGKLLATSSSDRTVLFWDVARLLDQ